MTIVPRSLARTSPSAIFPDVTALVASFEFVTAESRSSPS